MTAHPRCTHGTSPPPGETPHYTATVSMPTAPASRPRRAAVTWCILATLTVGAGTAIRFGPWIAPALAYLTGIGLALSLIDIRSFRIPDRLTALLGGGGVLLLALAAGGTSDPTALLRMGAGAVASGAVFCVLALARPGGLGLGDVKLAAVLGGYHGWFGAESWAWGTALPFLLGGAWTLALLILRRAHRHTWVPFGPFLVAGSLLAIFAT